MRIAVNGGGPGGLYFAALTKALRPDTDIRVWERNAPDDTFGFGVVFSDETLGGIEHADPVIYARMAERFARWDDVDVHFRGTLTTVGGQGFAAMSRKVLLHLLQERCAELGIGVTFRTEAPDVDALSRDYDLVIAADGVNSAVRTKYADVFGPSLDRRHNKYMWLGTDRVFEAFKFYICETPYGVMQVHGYPYDAGASTFIVEMREDVWRRAGFAESAAKDFPPGVSDEESIARIGELMGEVLQGHRVLANNSKWQNFTTVSNRTWRHGNVVLL
ncbi:MAG: bifunctional salicylyl-CoA 5-hydroxylase/oxidoreductase, partial [Kineosporiaceae bacterium]